MTRFTKLISEEDLATSLNSIVEALPREHRIGEALDSDNANKIYWDFFTECQEAFVFKLEGQLKKILVEMTKCKNAPVEWTIRAYEKEGIEEMKNDLMNMLDRTHKQMLCVMPCLQNRPKDEQDLKNCEYYIINGQHRVAASKSLFDNNATKELVKDFRK